MGCSGWSSGGSDNLGDGGATSTTTTTISSNVANGASAVAVKIAAEQDLTTAGAKIVSFGDNDGTSYSEKVSIDKDGVLTLPAGVVGAPSVNFGDASTGLYRSAANTIAVTSNGTQRFTIATALTGTTSASDISTAGEIHSSNSIRVSATAPIYNSTNDQPLRLQGRFADGASAVAVRIESHPDLSTSGAKILSIGDNAGTSYSEKAYVDKDGTITLTGAGNFATNGGNITTNGTGKLTTGGTVGVAASSGVLNFTTGWGLSDAAATDAILMDASTVFTADAAIAGFKHNSVVKARVHTDGGITSDPCKLTVGVGTVVKNGQLRRGLFKVTVPYTLFKAAATTEAVTIATLPAKVRVVGVIADTTAAYVLNADTFTLKVGRAGDDDGFIVSHDTSTAAVTKGLADGDLGTDINRASAIQGGYLGSWSGTTALTATLTSSATNLGDGATTALTAGSTTYYILTESMA